jgi:hypothetical protein
MNLTKKEFRQKWLEALRSGEYKQGRYALRQKSTDGDKFCCLGVACDLYNKLGVGDPLEVKQTLFGRNDSIPGVFYNEESTALPDSVRVALGLYSSSGAFVTPEGNGKYLAIENDRGQTFAQIADLIESEPDRLFFKETDNGQERIQEKVG